MQRLQFGDFELTAVSDGLYHSDGGAFFGVVPKSLWQKKVAADERNLIAVGLNSIVVRTGDHTVLIESGIGHKLSERMVKIYGQPAKLLDNLAEAGVSPEDIDVVINTHLHFDHCGWNTYYNHDGKPVATFPRATYYVQAGEMEHAHEQHERDFVSYMTDNYDPLLRSGQMKLLKGNAEIVPGISVELYPGHTRDLQAVVICSGGKVASYPSDLLCDAKHLDPTWVLGYDLYPLETIANKHRFYDRAIPEQWLVVFTHDQETPWGYLKMGDKGRPVMQEGGRPKVD